MKKLSVVALCLLLAAAVLLPARRSCAADGPRAGTAETVKQGAWALRGGKKTVLQPQTAVFVKDKLATDASGRLEVKFSDGTVIAMNPASEINISEFVMTDAQNSFGASVTKGVSRVITGALVKRNPNGFKISTPRATVGIRGTEVMFISTPGSEMISVMNMSSAYVNVIDNATAETLRLTAPGQSAVLSQNRQMVAVTNTPALNAMLGNISQLQTELTPQQMNDLLTEAQRSPVISQPAAPVQSPAEAAAVNAGSMVLNDASVLQEVPGNNRKENNDRNVNTNTTPQTRCN